MIKLYLRYVLAVVVIAVMYSCELETSGNGDLDGMWRLSQVDTLATQGVDRMEGKKLYWSFQYDLLQFDDKAGGHGSVLLRFERSGSTLRLHDPYVYDRENGDYQLDDVSLLSPFGMNSLDETFTIESIDGGKMVLRTEELRLYFRKL